MRSLRFSRSSTVADRLLRHPMVQCRERGSTLPRIDPATRIGSATLAKSCA
jgi:hypothetical protein